MKRYFFIFFISIFFLSTRQGFSDFNVFQYRKVIIGIFENKNQDMYNYLSESLQTHIYNYSHSILYLTITDKERVFLEQLAEKEEYREDFLLAGERIGYRFIPWIVKGAEQLEDWPLYIYGDYKVISEEEVRLTLYAHNLISDSLFTQYSASHSVESILNNPSEFLIPFFKEFLRYQTYSATLESEPRDSLLFIDGNLIGRGYIEDILLPVGYHRITVKKEGFLDYSDTFYINEDGFHYKAALEKGALTRKLKINTVPSDAQVYIGEKYQGSTPVEILVPNEQFTLTIIKDEYKDKIIHSSAIFKEVTSDGYVLELTLLPLIEEEVQYKSAETHKKNSKILAITGFGMLGVSILLGVEKTLYEQKADLHKINGDQDDYEKARSRANMFTILTVASAAVTGSVFTLSFFQLKKYFTLYSSQTDYQYYGKGKSIDLLRGHIRF